MRCTATAQAQRGAALLTAMVIVTVVASLSAAMVWQQWRAIQVETAERGRTQSYWLLTGAQDWARLILSEDKNAFDHLGDIWGTPLAEARLSTFLSADQNTTSDDGIEAFLSGGIVDLQSRYNLNNLIDPKGEPIKAEQDSLIKLCELAKAPSGTAEAIVQGLRLSWLPPDGVVPEGAGTLLKPQTVDNLTWFGLTPTTVELLRPFVTLLPARDTRINLNTASREVLVAVVVGLDQGSAQRLLQTRQAQPFEKVDDARKLLPSVTLDEARVGVVSSYFEVSGRLRLESQVVEERSLVERKKLDNRNPPQYRVTTWHRERINSVLPGAATR